MFSPLIYNRIIIPCDSQFAVAVCWWIRLLQVKLRGFLHHSISVLKNTQTLHSRNLLQISKSKIDHVIDNYDSAAKVKINHRADTALIIFYAYIHPRIH